MRWTRRGAEVFGLPGGLRIAVAEALEGAQGRRIVVVFLGGGGVLAAVMVVVVEVEVDAAGILLNLPWWHAVLVTYLYLKRQLRHGLMHNTQVPLAMADTYSQSRKTVRRQIMLWFGIEAKL